MELHLYFNFCKLLYWTMTKLQQLQFSSLLTTVTVFFAYLEWTFTWMKPFYSRLYHRFEMRRPSPYLPIELRILLLQKAFLKVLRNIPPLTYQTIYKITSQELPFLFLDIFYFWTEWVKKIYFPFFLLIVRKSTFC